MPSIIIDINAWYLRVSEAREGVNLPVENI